MAADELGFADLVEQAFGADAEVFVIGHEETDLAGEILVGLVVGRGREEDALAIVLADVFVDGAIGAALAVTQVVALVDDQQWKAAHIGQFFDCAGNREDLSSQTVLYAVVFPHWDKVFGTDDQCLQALVVLKDAGEGGGHECFAETDDIADEDAAALVEVMGGDLDGGRLEFEEGIAEIGGDAKFGEAGARLLGKMVGDLDVDVVRGDQLLACPTFVDDGGKLFGDVDAPTVVPTLFEPVGELVAGIMVEDVDVQLALTGEAGLGKVAAAQIADNWVDGVGAVEQVELGMERVGKEELDDELAGLELL